MALQKAPMRLIRFILIATLGTTGCRPASSARQSAEVNIVAAERFIDAFYSFDAERLASVLASADESAPAIRFYQGWAQSGHYRVVQRVPCKNEDEHTVRCAVTVEDDLIKALRLDLHVTDTFRITVSQGTIRRVDTSSNDPPLFEEAFAWVQRERAERVRQPCRDLFAGGPTPGACVRVMVHGFAEFAELRRRVQN